MSAEDWNLRTGQPLKGAAPISVADDPLAVAPAESWLQRWRNPSMGFLVSSGLHGCVLLLLALWVIPELVPQDQLAIVFSDETTVVPDEVAFAVSDVASPADETSSATADGGGSTAWAAASAAVGSVGTNSLSATSRIDPLRAAAPRQLNSMTPQVSTSSDLMHMIRPLRRTDAKTGGVVQRSSVGGALDGILGNLRGELDSDMVQVVWLLDASISLHTDRREIAARLVPFYKEMITRPNKREKPFRSSVVGFAAQPSLIQRSTENAARIVESIAGMSADPSGLENVFAAVQFALQSVSGWKGTTVIVIWTDESGDDLPMLENTIRLCREKGAIVHVVGPQAVLGMELGLQHWVIPETQQAFLLPVKRGPDAALPERLRLPYWFDSTSPPWSQGGAYISSGRETLGGPLREGLLSGVGPYALTRLALETGGTFSILQRQGDSPALAWEDQRNYLPDYNDVREIVSDVRRAPIRQAVVEAAAITWRADLRPPMRVFFGKPMDRYPFASQVVYQPPLLFQAALKSELPQHIAQADRDLQVVEAALDCMDPIRLETAYEAERLPRWRAWYDLNLGRLLAMSVRLAEYRETLRLVQNGVGISKETNNLVLVESGHYKTGRVAEQRAALAHKHLKKVQADHAGTPWARLADWELQHALGFVVQPHEIAMPKPVAGPVRPATGGGAPLLPRL